MTAAHEMGVLPFRMPVQSAMGGTARLGEFSGVVASGRILPRPAGESVGVRGPAYEVTQQSAG